MDEVDGMSAGDRGGVGALNALIKKSKVPSSFPSNFVSQRKHFTFFFQIPIICIANDRQAQKLKPLISTTFGIPFQKCVYFFQK